MITLIEALNYRCLRYVSQPLKPFHVLVGPNASGKTSFLDVIAFLGRLVSDGLDAAVEERSQNFYDLVWGREGKRFELAIEASIPPEHQTPTDSPEYEIIRYEVAIGPSDDDARLSILDQQIALVKATERGAVGDSTLFRSARDPNAKRLVSTDPGGGTLIQPEEPSRELMEDTESGIYQHVWRPNRATSVFERMDDNEEFPASWWLAGLLTRGVRRVELDSRTLRRPSPPGKGMFLAGDGSNLPGIIARLQERSPGEFEDWLAHLRTALPDLEGIRVVERPEDKHRYLMLRYRGGLEVPSWMLSDGTLRLLALTVIAYIPGQKPIFLIEEPENSVHPLNIETVMQSLRSVYEGQVLVATHSPTVLGVTDASDVLVFSRDVKEGTTITPGNEHPALKEWRGEVNLGTLFAGGVLG